MARYGVEGAGSESWSLSRSGAMPQAHLEGKLPGRAVTRGAETQPAACPALRYLPPRQAEQSAAGIAAPAG